MGRDAGLLLERSLALSPNKPGGTNLYLIWDDSPGSSSLHRPALLLGPTREEGGNIVLLLTIVLTLP